MRQTDDDYRKRLLALRSQLWGDVRSTTGIVAEMALGEEDDDWSDCAVSLIHTEDEMLEQIEKALLRIDDHTYGRCEDCGAKIPACRLKAIPYATRCVECAKHYETASD